MGILKSTESYVYKKEVDWSLLQEGLTLPLENQVVFGQTMGQFLKRGESKEITLYIGIKSYKAKIYNVNFDKKHNRKKDTLQIRYPKDGELARILQGHFNKSFKYIQSIRQMRDKGDRSIVRLPQEYKEYLAIYTTEYDDSYILEPIVADDLYEMKNAIAGQQELVMEDSFNFVINDATSTLLYTERMMKIRKLNKAIGDNLKLLYGFRCQICGHTIGERYGSQVIEAHHIDYFVKSMNNDSNNQLIICPNHHRIIHETEPKFDRKKKVYIYQNGLIEGLAVNYHL